MTAVNLYSKLQTLTILEISSTEGIKTIHVVQQQSMA